MVSKSRSVIFPKPVKTIFFTNNNRPQKKKDVEHRKYGVSSGNLHSSHPIPPAPTNNTFVLASRAYSSGPRMAFVCALRPFAVDIRELCVRLEREGNSENQRGVIRRVTIH